MNKRHLRRYFVEFSSSERNSVFLGAYFWKKAFQTLIWDPRKVNKALFDPYYARGGESARNNGPKGRYFGGRLGKLREAKEAAGTRPALVAYRRLTHN
ncbi:hypothetical protein LBW89_13005 [Paenibacillus sp. alder61]|uniref:hypothetical protein n=1 Tax=Paenibacillus sp. alder61 TaxID=2862948 RepID=UPI001CD317D4|nr:hypothetical protein [Paenibacillus sp. alder61]MCA1293939.1 hypothetical protein [Paenibacillus sp. alder61]